MAQEVSKFEDKEGLEIVGRTSRLYAVIGTISGPIKLFLTKDLSEKEITYIVNRKDELMKAIADGTIMLAQSNDFGKAYNLSNKEQRDLVIGLLTTKPFGVEYKVLKIEKLTQE